MELEAILAISTPSLKLSVFDSFFSRVCILSSIRSIIIIIIIIIGLSRHHQLVNMIESRKSVDTTLKIILIINICNFLQFNSIFISKKIVQFSIYSVCVDFIQTMIKSFKVSFYLYI